MVAPPPTTANGRCPPGAVSTTTPRSSRAWAKSAMGRWRMGAAASSTYVPEPSTSSGATKRDVVPLSRASRVTGPGAMWPSDPTTSRTVPSTDGVMCTPSTRKHSIMASVSSARRAPVSWVVPTDRAAHTNARLVSDLEPGTRTSASMGSWNGTISCGSAAKGWPTPLTSPPETTPPAGTLGPAVPRAADPRRSRPPPPRVCPDRLRWNG